MKRWWLWTLGPPPLRNMPRVRSPSPAICSGGRLWAQPPPWASGSRASRWGLVAASLSWKGWELDLGRAFWGTWMLGRAGKEQDLEMPEHLFFPSSSPFPWPRPSLTPTSLAPASSDPSSNTAAGVILFPPYGKRLSSLSQSLSFPPSLRFHIKGK